MTTNEMKAFCEDYVLKIENIKNLVKILNVNIYESLPEESPDESLFAAATISDTLVELMELRDRELEAMIQRCMAESAATDSEN